MRFDFREHFPYRVKIRNKIIIPIVLITLAASSLAVTAANRIFRQRLYTLIGQQMERSSDTVYSAIDEKLRDLDSLCQIMARLVSRSQLGGGAEPDSQAVMERVLQHSGYRMEMAESAAGLPAGSVPFWKGNQGASYGLRYRAETGELQLYAAATLFRQRTKSMILYTPVNQEFLSVIKRQTGFDVAIYLRGQEYCNCTFTDPVVEAYFRDAVKLPMPGDRMTGQARVGNDLYSYLLFPLRSGAEPQLYCLLVRDDTDLLLWQTLVRRDILLASLWFVGLLILIYTFIIRRLTRPLHQLMGAVERVGRGDFSTGTIVRSRDEIGLLSEAFQEMTASLRRNEVELHEATHQIIHQEKLASVGQLVAELMHETKNPLNSLALLIRLARDETDPRELGIYLGRMEEEVRRISRTAGMYLRLARKPAFSLEQINVPERVRTFLGHVDTLFESHGVELRTDLDEAVPDLRLDGGHLDQIIYNLVFNSLQAMSGGGVITLEVRAVHGAEAANMTRTGMGGGSPEKDRRYVLIRVADSGTGIPPEHLERVFDPFFTTKQAGEGTGLGLSIVKGVVESYGGFVHLTSRPGMGTTVDVYFPV